ncbi:beta-N-acetylglucosaminidase domain-containing protein [uncultured Catenibacterium sp.]|uniref:beta-N-acetylglucosaminidase domain-containing protein n=1 Tax=uncultured Catenibacterium sp. TaxID=286142 RepID=UPI0025EDA135|nr:beta-N-acetylglucosaminidase domain-containing protein [uncultured Catenibacterium sp.]
MKGKKVITYAVSFLVALGCVSAFPMTVQADTGYEVYPNPHTMSYSDGDYEMTSQVNVVYEDGIDADTKARLNEVLALKGMNASVSSEKKAGKTNILVGVKGSKQYVDSQFGTTSEGLFDKLDSYALKSDKGTISILGKDTDAAFYGLTSLYHIFKQVEGKTIRNFSIEDYADVASRGFIEGYYGNPWSTEDRCKLMEWGGYYKLNSYFYAPKDDPKHNGKWRELYTDQEIETKIKPLAEAGNKSKCRFVFALHPYMNNPIRYNSEANYQADLKVMQAKFKQVIDAGVRQIAILADDAPNVGGANYTRTLTDMSNWLKELQPSYPGLKLTLPFCTQEYMGWGQSYYRDFPENVQIIMTGGRVWGEVTNNFTSSFTNTAGRGPYMWINWPCTDNSKKHLIMGGYTTFLHPGVDPSKIQGIVLNPMQQSEPSKVAIFGNACYSWNIWQTEEEANKCYNDSFKYVDHNGYEETEASTALRELSKHMINQNMDSRVTRLEESVELRDKLQAFKTKLTKGEKISDEEFDEMINAFTVLQNASKIYRESGNERIKSQIVYWLNCWDDTTNAALNYIKGIQAAQNEEANATIWDYFSAAQAAFEKSKSYGFHYVDHLEYAEVGVQHIVPFIKSLDSYLSEIASTIVNPDKQIAKYITNREDTPAGKEDNIFDGNASTELVYKSPNSIFTGTYVGIKYSKAIDVNHVIFRVGANSNPRDTFLKAKVQYTTDGKNWTDVNDTEYDLPNNVELTDLNLKGVKGIRMIATADKSNTWLGVRDILVNPTTTPSSPADKGTLSLTKLTLKGGSLDNLLDDNESSYAHFAESPYKGGEIKDYIPVDAAVTLTFNNPKKLGTINFSQDGGTDKLTKYVLEYTADGETWKTLKEYAGDATVHLNVEDQDITAKAIRVRNLELHLSSNTAGYWWKLKTFNHTDVVNEYDDKAVYTNTDYKLHSKSTLDRTDLVYKKEMTLAPKQYVGVKLSRVKDLKQLELDYTGDVVVEASVNAHDWVEVTDLNNNLPDARYVRLINKKSSDVKLTLNKFVVHSTEVTAPYLYKTTMTINPSWGVAEDTRNNGAAFDGNIDSTTEFGDLPQKGQYIIYDLGQMRNIDKLAMYCQDSAVNYIRDATISVSSDLENWTDVVTIGDGVENIGDAGVQCIDSDAGYKASSTYPNKVYVSGTANHVPARYLRILFTASNNNRAVVFNEIMINDGEYAPEDNDPTFESSVTEAKGYKPQYMIDGDLLTSYKPGSNKAGYLTYTLSDRLNVKKFNIIQKGEISNAKVYALIDKEVTTRNVPEENREWVQLGTLRKSLNEFYIPHGNVYKLKFEWEENHIPTISEIITLTDEEYKSECAKDLKNYIDSLHVEEDKYTATSYNAYKTARDAALNAYNTQMGEKDALEEAKANLKTAHEGLTALGDLKALEAEIKALDKLSKDDYTEESYQALMAVKAEAEILLKNEDASVEEVDAMLEQLATAKAALVTKVSISKKTLRDYIDSNNLNTLDTSIYLTSTVTPFKDALNNAEDILNKENATVTEVEDAYKALHEARKNLVLKATDAEVKALENKMASYKEEDYTASSWKEFVLVLDEIREELKAEHTSEEITALTEKLDTASKKLVRRGNTAELDLLLAQAKKTDSKLYTEKSYKNLLEVIKAVEKALENKAELTQEEVDALTKDLRDAMEVLEKLPVITPSKPEEKPTTPSKPEETTKPEVKPSTKPATGDTTMVGLFAFFSMISLLGYVLLKKKEA